jgi:MoxR-like ATPase
MEGAKCERIFIPISESVDRVAEKLSADKSARRAAFGVIPKFEAYFHAIGERVLERAGLVDLAEVALISEEHLLMMGPPGNAKSQLSDFVLGNMTDAKGEKSYFRIQMTPETTMSETHGPMDYKKLSDTGEYDRLHEQGMGAKRNIFIDEIFDARANAQRNILGLLAERSHAQGSHVIKAEIETVIGATNRYLSEVYEKAGDDGPKAVLDRFALVAFVPATFEETSSYVQLIQRSKKPSAPIPDLKFEEVEALRALVPQVEISEAVAKALSLLSTRMKAETEALEAASLKSYADKLKNGEEPSVPYRATKYHSPRTIGKASAILRAFVVKDWVDKRGKRKLEATIQDLAQLVKFFTLNGPSEAFVKSEMARTSNKHERAQLMAILQEREIFERHYNKIVEEMDGATVHYALSELAGVVGNAKTADEKQAAAQAVIAAIAQVVADKAPNGLQSELTGAEIGKDLVQSYLEGLLKGLVSTEEFATMKRTVLDEIERQKREMIERAEAAHRKEQERLRDIEREVARKEAAAKAEAELAERRAEELRSSFTDTSKFTLAGELTGHDPRNGNVSVAYDPATEKLAVYFRGSDQLRLYDTKKVPSSGDYKAQVVDAVLGDEKIDDMAIGEMHFVDSDTLMFLTTNGKAAMTYKLSTKSVDTTSISVKDVATSYDPIAERTVSFDPSTLKLKSFKDSSVSTEQFKFIDMETPQRHWDEATFKSEINDDGMQLQVADNGKYAVLVSVDKQSIFKLDFERKEVTPIPYEEARSQTVSSDSARSILHWYDSEVVVVDRSGDEPVVKKMTNMSPLRGQMAMGAALVEGTNLLIMSRGNDTGLELINGTDGSVLSEIFQMPGHIPYAMKSYAEGYVFFTYASNTWHLKIMKRTQKAE